MSPSDPLARSLDLPCGVSIPNRLGKSAMTEGLAGVDGHACDRHARLYRKWSEGGAGLSITGNVMVDWRYLERPGNVVVEDRAGLDGLRAWAEAGTVGGNQLWVQISHPGRQCSRMSNGHPVAPSAVQLRMAGFFGRPRELTADEIPALVGRYAATARIVQEAGFTGVQVHGAHGYLISQFLSPRVNRRTDTWGGSLENRARFLLEVVRAVRREVGAGFPVSVKLNSADFQKGGFELADAAEVASMLAAEGVDLLEISGGTYERLRFFEADDGAAEESPEAPRLAAGSAAREAYFLRYAETIRERIGDMPLMVTGGFRSRRTMEDAVESGAVDLIGLARPLCVDPALPRALLDGSITEATRWEDRLRLGPGPFGPTSPIKEVRGFNHQAAAAWFYRQILALADDRPQPTDLAARTALRLHLFGEARMAVARRRAWARHRT